ncbi:hypothetical protein LAY57_17345 [Argonema antarcticum A004/B2]|nr:hypothetical protein [Argonema antarcticum A004/B2]
MIGFEDSFNKQSDRTPIKSDRIPPVISKIDNSVAVVTTRLSKYGIGKREEFFVAWKGILK